MTKSDALNLLQYNSRGRKDFHKSQYKYWIGIAEEWQQSFRKAKTVRERKPAEFYYLCSLQRADAHLTLINR